MFFQKISRSERVAHLHFAKRLVGKIYLVQQANAARITSNDVMSDLNKKKALLSKKFIRYGTLELAGSSGF